MLVVFLLIGSTGLAEWYPGEPNKMHYPQLPDPMGWDVCLETIMLADDFRCTETADITDIHFWVSFRWDEFSNPPADAWIVQIFSDRPSDLHPCGHEPGELLWQWNQEGDYELIHYGEGSQGWFCPPEGIQEPQDHMNFYQVNIRNISDPWKQFEGEHYWLVIHGPQAWLAGWKTTIEQSRYRCPGMWLSPAGGWQPVVVGAVQPQEKDFAFVITGDGGGPEELDFGDAPERPYPTTLASNGARHVIGGPWLGDRTDNPDMELDGQPDPNALGDDNDGNDDEDGVQIPVLTIGQADNIIFDVNGGGGVVDAWIDFDSSGVWDEPAERILGGVFYPDGTHAVAVTPPANSAVGDTFARFRISGQGGLLPVGQAHDGEVEDYQVTIEEEPELIDFGDAPDGPYPTLLASNGAQHTINPRIYLGNLIDDELDGQPTADANGDDVNDLDDEDGIIFTSPLIRGNAATIDVNASVAGNFYGWIDFNADGDWDDAGEQIFAALPINAGVNHLCFNVPLPAVGTPHDVNTIARFRFTTAQIVNLSYDGWAQDGEVEDYKVHIEGPEEFPHEVKWLQKPDLSPTGIDIRIADGGGGNHRIADDFECKEPGLITDVHFWASWKDDIIGEIKWFTISIYSDIPASQSHTEYSMPGELLWQRRFSKFDETLQYCLGPHEYEWWWDPFWDYDEPNSQGDQKVWRYDIQIDPRLAFRQEGSPDAPRVYWIEIMARVPYVSREEIGWKTSIDHWNDNAVWFDWRNIDPAQQIWRELIYPQGHELAGQPIDMAFALTTGAEPNEPNDPKFKYIQKPDKTPAGMDIRCDRSDGTMRTIADDFPCVRTGPITDVHLWGSWLNDYKGKLEMIHLSIHEDIPAWENVETYTSMPGELLWEKDFFPEDFNETRFAQLELPEWWFDPYTQVALPDGDNVIWQYDLYIHPEEAFIQRGKPDDPVIYWLDVWAKISPDTPETQFGWKTSCESWNDVAVYDAPAAPGWWNILYYPDGHPLHGEHVDMAFAITTCPKCADLNQDGIVDFLDLGIFVEDWLWVGWPGYLRADLDCDGMLQFDDYAIFASQWKQSCP